LSFFDLVFYFLAGLGVLILASVINSLIGGRRRSAWMTLRVYLIVVAIYAAFLVATTLALPIQVLTANETQYSGDWSIAVASMRRIPHDLDEDYELDFRLSNRGSKVLHGDSHLTVYLLTEDGTRVNPAPEPSAPRFDVEIQPGKSVTTTRKFVMATNLNRLELVVTRAGFRWDWFVVGRHPLDGRTVVQIQ
jgi:hypothetical protein